MTSRTETATVAGRLQTLRHCTGRTVTFASAAPIAACTAANIPGPTTVLPSAVLQVMQTLTSTGRRDAVGTAGTVVGVSSAGRARSIPGSGKDPVVGSRALLGRADGFLPSKPLPSGAPRPDASKAQYLMAGLLTCGSLPRSPPSRDVPVASAKAIRSQLRGQCRIWV